jgi:hypothetical protein
MCVRTHGIPLNEETVNSGGVSSGRGMTAGVMVMTAGVMVMMGGGSDNNVGGRQEVAMPRCAFARTEFP